MLVHVDPQLMIKEIKIVYYGNYVCSIFYLFWQIFIETSWNMETVQIYLPSNKNLTTMVLN